ncbi:DUF4435 domain-containing protein [Myroides marinus]|uniref:DUF4435 domain-containing protein n=1 Tax=Myroides marinus TaxID=703342 RepID=UPI002577B763|nr:DUF4435 domain-containing protein [Myroides marinus]
MTDFKGLFILPRYCIENFLIDEDALISIIDDEDPNADSTEIKKNLDYQGWYQNNEEKLVELFIIYAIINQYSLGIKNVQYKVTNLTKDKSGIICLIKIQEKINNLKKEIREHPGFNFDLDSEISIRRDRISRMNNRLLTFVSAKDYLFPLLKTRIQDKHKFTSNNVSLKLRLVKSTDFKELNNILDYVIE